jgi:hypothetical protein
MSSSYAVVIENDSQEIPDVIVLDGPAEPEPIPTASFVITDGSSVTIDPSQGGIQLWQLGANRSPVLNFTDGQQLLLMINDGSAFSITWPGVSWLAESTVLAPAAPVLKTSGYTVVKLWRAAGVVYGKLEGYTA